MEVEVQFSGTTKAVHQYLIMQVSAVDGARSESIEMEIDFERASVKLNTKHDELVRFHDCSVEQAMLRCVACSKALAIAADLLKSASRNKAQEILSKAEKTQKQQDGTSKNQDGTSIGTAGSVSYGNNALGEQINKIIEEKRMAQEAGAPEWKLHSTDMQAPQQQRPQQTERKLQTERKRIQFTTGSSTWTT